jgi:hypothetical protein
MWSLLKRMVQGLLSRSRAPSCHGDKRANENSLVADVSLEGVKLAGAEQLLGHPIISKDMQKALDSGLVESLKAK